MKVYYSLYTLTPLRKANRLSSMRPINGVYLKGVLGNRILFADYFPHISLGDDTCDQFLDEFKFQDFDYARKVFDLLLRDRDLQKMAPQSFLNHQLWNPSEGADSPVIKYKLEDQLDRHFLSALKNGQRLRLDANALFSRNEYEAFVKTIPTKYLPQIDYIEDPMHDPDWPSMGIPVARDFIPAPRFDYYIYKPNCEFKPSTEVKIIYSSYLGSDLGRWHAYCELIENGDLSLTHGIYTEGFYQEEEKFMVGSYRNGFTADKKIVNSVYDTIYNAKWKSLCSM